ncbi:MAG: alpha/beta fold hydrolase [Defluviitaleaceae bacterium]|nr:alpha/beta fold hydrolase [Defluviitaleaceae bacterium]
MERFAAGDIKALEPMLDDTLGGVDFRRLREIITFTRGGILDYSITDRHVQLGQVTYDVSVRHELGYASYYVALGMGGAVSAFVAQPDSFTLHVGFDDGPRDYIIEPITVGAGTVWELGGELTLPAGASAENPVPAVVLVHGSGPSNRDAEVFGTRHFFTIADYLARSGIAAVRYDKRTYTHGAGMARAFGGNFTVWEETIEDAVSAAQLLRSDPRIGSVYLLGWSLGGVLAPRIHASGGDFDGLILFAGSPRNVMEIAVEQFTAELAELDRMGFGHMTEVEPLRLSIQTLAEIFDGLATMSEDEAKSTPLPLLGANAYYFWDMEIHSFERYAADITVPILVMQGANDFQVRADTDFAMLQALLSVRDNAAFILYDGLDHFFLPSIARNFREHGEIIAMRPPGMRLGEDVLRDIADWINDQG